MLDQATAEQKEGASTPEEQDVASKRTPRPERSNVITILSTLSAATLISLFVGLCSFYTHYYREAFLGPFGLDPEALPLTAAETIAEGFQGVVENVLWIAALLAIFILLYIALVWLLAHLLKRLIGRFGITPKQREPSQALVEFGRNEGVQATFLASCVAVGAALAGVLALILVGLPAEKAGTRAHQALLDKVNSPKALCTRYVVDGGVDLVGLPIGNTGDHQFVLGNDDAVHVVKFEALTRLELDPVACRSPKRSSGIKANAALIRR